MSMFGVYQETLNEVDKPFAEKQRVGFRIKEFEIKTGDFPKLVMNTQVLDGATAGQAYVFTIGLKTDERSLRAKGQFLRCFFPREELLANTYDGKKIIGKCFSAVPTYLTGTRDGRVFTAWDLYAPVNAATEAALEPQPFNGQF